MNTIAELDDAMAIPMLNELNPFMKDFKNAGLAFAKKMNEVSTYYKMNDYNGDNFEKGKTMHQPVINAFQQFYQADSILRVHSDKAMTLLDEEYMQLLKADGLEVQYLPKNAVDKATVLMKVLSTTDFEKLNAAELKELHDPLRTAFDELTALKTNDYDTFNSNPSIIIFYSNLERIVISSNELHERVKEQRAFTDFEQRQISSGEVMARVVKGSPNKVSSHYKELIESYNSLL